MTVHPILLVYYCTEMHVRAVLRSFMLSQGYVEDHHCCRLATGVEIRTGTSRKNRTKRKNPARGCLLAILQQRSQR